MRVIPSGKIKACNCRAIEDKKIEAGKLIIEKKTVKEYRCNEDPVILFHRGVFFKNVGSGNLVCGNLLFVEL
jgi:hypothetical protein